MSAIPVAGLALVLAASCSLARPEPDLGRYEYRQIIMGAEARIVLHAPHEDAARAAAAAAFARMNELDAILSDWRVDSELNHLCAQAGGPASPVSEDLYTVLDVALQVAAASGGAFDPTVGPLTRLWRAARATGKPPSPEQIAAARRYVGYQHLHLEPAARTVQLELPGMQLDLGGIGKGYACDEAGEVLRAHSTPRFLIDFGGEILTGEGSWRVLVHNQPLCLSQQALATSGDSEQHLDAAGQRLSHVLDARTGDALVNAGELSVLASSSTVADALATACSLVSREEREPLSAAFGARLLVP
ncbi:MAG: FAD:protein FMN transferase [Planctomycetota bacterium]|nr:MAG: FAD:protein FMN transferase [Planctomycetota bacterium]